MTPSSFRAACMQLCSTEDVDENLANIEAILKKNSNRSLDLVLLPENAILVSQNQGLKSKYAQKEAYFAIFKRFSLMAKRHHIWLIAGTLLIQDEQHPSKHFNHCPVFSPEGVLVNAYNKIHLFDADLRSESWQESQDITAGKEPVAQALTDFWSVGLSVCYDLRFPELYRSYSQKGCNILTVPAAFTVPTGQAHWEVLLRARAIENQSYVLAAAQWGQHADGRKTYGHSMIIDPWGNILTHQECGQGLIYVDLSQQELQDLQQRMPVLNHRQ